MQHSVRHLYAIFKSNKIVSCKKYITTSQSVAINMIGTLLMLRIIKKLPQIPIFCACTKTALCGEHDT